MSDQLAKHRMTSHLARIAMTTCAIAVIGCSSEKPTRESRASMYVTDFCAELAMELASWARQYKHVNEMPAGPDRDDYESHLLLRPTIYARGPAVHQLQRELSLCVRVRKLDPAARGAHSDEVYFAVTKLLDGDDTVTIGKALDALWPVAKKLNDLPFDEGDL